MVSLTLPEETEIPTVNRIEDGFKVVPTQYGPAFHCETCDIPVEP